MRSVVALTLALSALAAPHVIEKRAQCAATLQIAIDRANSLQSHYFNKNGTGQYQDGSLWTDANAFEDLHNLMLGANNDAWSTLAETSFIGRKALAGSATDWNGVLAGSNDDAQWIILSLWKMADYKYARGKDGSPYVNAARTIYNIIAQEWDTSVCGGGMWWSKAHTYKNAITNQLFLYVSAEGYIRFREQVFLDNANKEWAWLSASGMRNSDGLWNDGLTSDCKNNGQTTWTYNQGVIASGLGALFAARGSTDTSLLDQAEITLNATISRLTVNGILKEGCDDAKSSGCNHDQQIFKGIWMKHLQFYLDRASADRAARFKSFIGAQSSAIIHYGTNANGDIGNVWYAPSQGGSIFSPESSTSGVAGQVAAAKYGPC
ncbi:glycoside hydrolase family 76 protein [Exidia glandulosa HHB12029]|uniref:Glycoside hydrolase family 76 protein n=1 Tax=Exidia glandulosa HHB12029 TaxID=1314781 RepID=A0A165CMF1_EXIGL|nr:glycoside hydrolase family 76 protein [Exidia glandulosa HHB12029]